MKRYADLGGGIPPACRLGLATRGTSKLDVRDVRAAIDRGINYLNWCGHPDGLSRAISELGSQRDEVVIAWQIMARDAERAGPELDAALKELQTDRIDIVTLYYIESDAEWAGIKAPDGALSAVEAAKSDGRVRIVELTSHQRKLAAKWAAIDRLDMLMLRYNAANRGAETEVFPVTRRRGMPFAAYTCLRWGALMDSTPADPEKFVPPPPREWHRFVLSHPDVSVALMAPREPVRTGARSGPAGRLEIPGTACAGGVARSRRSGPRSRRDILVASGFGPRPIDLKPGLCDAVRTEGMVR